MTTGTAVNSAGTPELSQNDYIMFRDFLVERTGLFFPEKRREDLERGLFEGLAASGLSSLTEYFEALTADRSEGLMTRLVSRLTVSETYFNRDSSQFDLLRREILPKLIESRIATTRTLRIWSAGCATGEEPYSLAILLRETIPYIDNWDVTILATDIDRESIERAGGGRYGHWSFRNMPQEWLDKYFFVSNTSEFHLSDAIKDQVTLTRVNLKDNVYPSPLNRTINLDLIVCRNVMIYFDEKTTSEVLSRFHSCLGKGAWLLTGASDPIPPKDLFRARNFSGAFIYQKSSPEFDARKQKRPKAAIPTPPAAKRRAERQEKSRPPKTKQPAPAPDSRESLAAAEALLEVGQPGLAAEKASLALECNPKSAAALLLMARVEAARGDLGRADQYIRKVVTLDKLNAPAYYLQSAIRQTLGETHEAVESLKKTTYLEPGFIAAHFNLACLYKQLGQGGLARKSWHNALKLMVGRKKDEIVPETHGVSYGTLKEIVEASLKQETQ